MFRLIGTAMVVRLGRGLTPGWMDGAHDQGYVAEVWPAQTAVIASKRPHDIGLTVATPSKGT